MNNTAWKWANFKEAFLGNTPNMANLSLRHSTSQIYVDWLDKLYNRAITLQDDTMHLPKIVHYVWFSNNPIPDLYQQYKSECMALNKDYQFILWDDDKIAHELSHDLDISLWLVLHSGNVMKTLYKDYLFFLILNKYGGIALDMDYMCKQPFAVWVKGFDFITSLEPHSADALVPPISTSFIASVEHNHILDSMLDNFRTCVLEQEYQTRLTDLFHRVAHNKSNSCNCQHTMLETLYYADINDQLSAHTIILPHTYTNPIYGWYFLQRYYQTPEIITPEVSYEMWNEFHTIYPHSVLVQDWNETFHAK